jgi:maintenance of morphology protein 1
MPSNYLFSFQPTFTQGLILGQLSILVLFGLILKYLFLDSTHLSTSFYHPRVESDQTLRIHDTISKEDSTEWFNVILKQVSFSLSLKGCILPYEC